MRTKRCFGCEQRDEWIEKQELEIAHLKRIIKSLEDDHK